MTRAKMEKSVFVFISNYQSRALLKSNKLTPDYSITGS